MNVKLRGKHTEYRCQNDPVRVSLPRNMSRTSSIFALVLFLPVLFIAAGGKAQPVTLMPPSPLREFRGAWIAVVATNQDWPSKPGLPVTQQKAELISLLDRAAQLHFNAVIFQVRPACDAIYASPIEPWSERITGVQGRAPQPFYDPLAFAIAEAHKRGLELHAWFNPFRATHPLAESRVALNHISRTHPELIRKYGKHLVLDPGEPAAQAHTLDVVLDVVNRYDIDGVVFDDYFYPYPENDAEGHKVDFPDNASWQKYGLRSGLSRADWRRQNVNQFIQRVYQSIKPIKPWVQFGVSPFGIWRPGFPKQIQGMDAYAEIYADSRLWLANGWLDYLAPQLYWPIAPPAHSFPVLLQWWRSQNLKARHVFAGLNDAAVGATYSVDEIARQVQIIRSQADDGGEIHFHLRNITQNPALAAAVRAQYTQPALVPLSSWIAVSPPLKPKLLVVTGNDSAHVRWEYSDAETPRNWLLQSRMNGSWTTQIFPANQMDCYLDNGRPDGISLCAVDRLGNLSEPAVWSPKNYSAANTSRGAVKMRP
jgi:uncharacterized lipoprotein YddW (UPF0748 family)